MLEVLPIATRATSLRTSLEDAVIEALSSLKLEALGGSSEGYLQKIAPYQGDLSPAGDGEDGDIARVCGGRMPAVLVTTGDGAYLRASMGAEEIDEDTTVEILIVSGNLRSPEAAARGDGFSDDPGIYRMIEDIRGKLWGIDLHVSGAGPLIPQTSTARSRSGVRSIWQLSFAVTLDAPAPEREADDYDEIFGDINNADDAAADPVVEFNRQLL
jgi:hypothetical protein